MSLGTNQQQRTLLERATSDSPPPPSSPRRYNVTKTISSSPTNSTQASSSQQNLLHSARTSQRRHTPRRSLAHRPELLGLGSPTSPKANNVRSNSQRSVSGRGRRGSISSVTSGTTSTTGGRNDIFNADAESEADCYELQRVDLDEVRVSMERSRMDIGTLSGVQQDIGSKGQEEEEGEEEEEEENLPSFGHDILPPLGITSQREKPTTSASNGLVRLDDEAFMDDENVVQNHQQDLEAGRRSLQEELDLYTNSPHDFRLYEEDDDDYETRLGTKKSLLHFEKVTKREKAWMWCSVGFVAILTVVSVSISVDWIDWPGDGIGQY